LMWSELISDDIHALVGRS